MRIVHRIANLKNVLVAVERYESAEAMGEGFGGAASEYDSHPEKACFPCR
jgi:hypothetical protein